MKSIDKPGHKPRPGIFFWSTNGLRSNVSLQRIGYAPCNQSRSARALSRGKRLGWSKGAYGAGGRDAQYREQLACKGARPGQRDNGPKLRAGVHN